MQMAARFEIPIIALVDTPGAYPGIGAEERGQSEAIAINLAEMFDLSTPIIATVIGEGGSGGALGIAVADRVLMMEYSVYSVISPESCASILWSDPKMAETAANALKLGPEKALELGVIDALVSEPSGGAHRDPEEAAEILKKILSKEIKSLAKMSRKKLLEERFEKFRAIGNKTLNFDQENDQHPYL
jgi:acetyl-CoA carboxylase carboxyl transferase subunit alpha